MSEPVRLNKDRVQQVFYHCTGLTPADLPAERAEIFLAVGMQEVALRLKPEAEPNSHLDLLAAAYAMRAFVLSEEDSDISLASARVHSTRNAQNLREFLAAMERSCRDQLKDLSFWAESRG